MPDMTEELGGKTIVSFLLKKVYAIEKKKVFSLWEFLVEFASNELRPWNHLSRAKKEDSKNYAIISNKKWWKISVIIKILYWTCSLPIKII